MVLNGHRNHKSYQGRGEGEEGARGRLYDQKEDTIVLFCFKSETE